MLACSETWKPAVCANRTFIERNLGHGTGTRVSAVEIALEAASAMHDVWEDRLGLYEKAEGRVDVLEDQLRRSRPVEGGG